MEKYLISFDLDGTLLNKKEKIPFFAKLAIGRLLKNGHHIIINTGRSLQGTIQYIKELKLFNYPFICNNGGTIYYINRKLEVSNCIYNKLNTKKMNAFLDSLKKDLIFTTLHGLKDKYYFHPNEVPSFFNVKGEDNKYTEIANFNITHPIVMVSFSVKKIQKTKVDKILEKYKKDFSILYWGDDDKYSYYDIHAINTSKGDTMIKLADMLKIKHENIIAYGDEINDVSMLKKAQYGFFVKSKPSIKLAPQYQITITKKDSNALGAINHLYKNFKKLF